MFSVPDLEIFSGLSNYKCIVFNVENKSITEFTNFNFDSIITFKSQLYMCNKTGIYKYTGTTDNGVKITSEIKLPTNDFGTQLNKSIIEISNHGDEFVVTPIYDETISTYDYKSIRNRVKFGKGLFGRVIGLIIKNVFNKGFEINSLEFEIGVSDQRKLKN